MPPRLTGTLSEALLLLRIPKGEGRYYERQDEHEDELNYLPFLMIFLMVHGPHQCLEPLKKNDTRYGQIVSSERAASTTILHVLQHTRIARVKVILDEIIALKAIESAA